MPELIAMIQTAWPNIRVALYKRDNGLFQFVEEGLDESSRTISWQCGESGLFSDINAAKEAMLHHYCEFTEDEYRVIPQSVTTLEAPDFKGPHHPIRIVNVPEASTVNKEPMCGFCTRETKPDQMFVGWKGWLICGECVDSLVKARAQTDREYIERLMHDLSILPPEWERNE